MWSFLTSNPQVDESSQKAKSEKQKENLRFFKSNPQTGRPQSHHSSNSSKNSKKQQLKEDREFQIFKENQILLKKMLNIDSKPSMPKNYRTDSVIRTGRSLSRTHQQFKIFQENQKFLRRLQNTSSHYSTVRFEEENKYHQYLKSKISKKQNVVQKKSEKKNKENDLITRILKRREIRLKREESA